jgi:hypothetical protein
VLTGYVATARYAGPVESLGRLRQPAAFVIFGTLCLEVIAAVVSLLVLSRNGGYGSTADVALSVGARFPHALTIVVLVLLAASCLLGQPTGHARTLALLTIIVGGVAVLQQLAYALIGLAAGGTGKSLGLVATLLSLVVPVVAVLGLGLLMKARSAATRRDASTVRATSAAGQQQQPTSERPAAIAGPAHPPTWQPEAATGVAWHTAGEAAAGAPGAGWGSAEAPGWQPIPGQTSAPREQTSGTGQQSSGPGPQVPKQPTDPWDLDWTSRPGGQDSERR